MDFSRSRIRQGDGPQLVKTYGRFRQRMVNRDAKIAEEFTKATSVKPLIAEMLGSSSSDSDFEPEPVKETVRKPVAKPEPKLEHDAKSQQRPRTKAKARAKMVEQPDPIKDFAATPVAGSATPADRKVLMRRCRSRAPAAADADTGEAAATQLQSSAAPKPKKKNPPPAVRDKEQSGKNKSNTPKLRATVPKATDHAVGRSQALHTQSRKSSAMCKTDASEYSKPIKDSAVSVQMKVSSSHFADSENILSRSSQLANEMQDKPAIIDPGISGNVTKRRTARSRRAVPLQDTSARSASKPQEAAVERKAPAAAYIQREQHRPQAEPGQSARAQAASCSSTKDITRRISRIRIAEDAKADLPGRKMAEESSGIPAVSPAAVVQDKQASRAPPGWTVTERNDVVSTRRRTNEHARQGYTETMPTSTSTSTSMSKPVDKPKPALDTTVVVATMVPLTQSSNKTDRSTTGNEEVDDEESEGPRLLATRTMRFKAPRNAPIQTCEVDDMDEDSGTIEDASHKRKTMVGTVPASRLPADDSTRTSPKQPYDTQQQTQEIALDCSEPLTRLPCTPPRSNRDSRISTPSHNTASATANVPHSPSRMTTPHRVVFSPMRPVTQMRPAHRESDPERLIPNATKDLAQLSAPALQKSVARLADNKEQLLQQQELVSRIGDERLPAAKASERAEDAEFEETKVPFLPARRYVQKTHILAACGQTAPIDWAAGGLQACGVLLPELDSAQHSEEELGKIESESGLCKIGEATYSEVFSAQWRYVPRTRYDKFNSKKGKVKGERLMQVALKIIPFGNTGVKSGTGEPQTTLRDLYQEIGATLALSRLSERERAKLQEARMQVKMPLKVKERELGANFVKAFRVCICQGPLPDPLLRAWDRWKTEYPELCENLRPDYYPQNQLFAVFVLEMGGETLENATVSTWKEARSIIRQLALSMALAERNSRFEHRDLHWGNIMVTRYNSNLTFLYQLPPMGSRSKSTLISIPSYRLRCTIIDYTLSRLHIDNDPEDAAAASASKPAAYDPSNNVFYVSLKDESLFQGEGDIQFDVYRQMRACSKGDWEGFHPHTNVLWLTYVLQKIIATKSPKIMEELVEFVESKLGPAFGMVPPEIKKAAGQELLRRWVKEFEQCESSSQVLTCALLDLYKG